MPVIGKSESNIREVTFVIFAPVTFVVLWLGLRWPIRRVLLVSVVVGLVADALFDAFLARMR